MSSKHHSKTLTDRDYLILTLCKYGEHISTDLSNILGITPTSTYFRMEKLKQLGLLTSRNVYRKGHPVDFKISKDFDETILRKYFTNKIKELNIYKNFLENGGFNQLKNKLVNISQLQP